MRNRIKIDSLFLLFVVLMCAVLVASEPLSVIPMVMGFSTGMCVVLWMNDRGYFS